MTDALLKMQQEMAHVLQVANAKIRVAGLVATVLLGNTVILLIHEKVFVVTRIK